MVQRDPFPGGGVMIRRVTGWVKTTRQMGSITKTSYPPGAKCFDAANGLGCLTSGGAYSPRHRGDNVNQ
jgi:hypothetical protein